MEDKVATKPEKKPRHLKVNRTNLMLTSFGQDGLRGGRLNKENLSQMTQVFFVDRNIELSNLVRFELEEIKSIFD